jgi:hypothetical protein
MYYGCVRDKKCVVRDKQVVLLDERGTKAALYSEKGTKCLIEEMESIRVHGLRVWVGKDRWYWLKRGKYPTIEGYNSLKEAEDGLKRRVAGIKRPQMEEGWSGKVRPLEDVPYGMTALREGQEYDAEFAPEGKSGFVGGFLVVKGNPEVSFPLERFPYIGEKFEVVDEEA